jgi:hypothetical protein
MGMQRGNKSNRAVAICYADTTRKACYFEITKRQLSETRSSDLHKKIPLSTRRDHEFSQRVEIPPQGAGK